MEIIFKRIITSVAGKCFHQTENEMLFMLCKTELNILRVSERGDKSFFHYQKADIDVKRFFFVLRNVKFKIRKITNKYQI